MGRPVKKPPENFAELARHWENGKLRTIDFMKQTGLTETTLYRRLRERQIAKKARVFNRKVDKGCLG